MLLYFPIFLPLIINMKKNFVLYFVFIMSVFHSPENASAQTIKTKARLNHIAIYVVNLQTSSAFYRDIIGLDTIPEPFHDGRHTWFSIGPQSHLHVISGAAAPTAHDKNAHLCFSVSSVGDFIPILNKNNIEWSKIQKGSPQQNAIIERFNKTVREDLLDPNLFFSLDHANDLAQEFVRDYNYERPHESLNNKTPIEYAA